MDKISQKTTDREYYLFAIKIFGDFGATIAIPAIIAVFSGNYLDKYYGKYPLFTVLCLIASFLLTVKIIKKKAKVYGDEYQKMINREKIK